MDLFERVYPTFVSGLGGFGLGTAVVYFLGVFLVFRPGWVAWREFFIVWGPPLAAVPGGSLIAHLYLRTHLGGWWVDRGRFEEAIEYTESRLDPGPLRARKETLYHRIYRARARIGLGEYDRALEALTEGVAVPETGREAAAMRRWQLEAALRLEDPAEIGEAVEAGLAAEPEDEVRAALHGGRAEWAVLEGSSEAYHTHIERGRESDAENRRLALARGFGAVRFGRDDAAFRKGLDALDFARERADREVPHRGAEIRAVRAQLLERLGRAEEARRVLREAESAPADARSRRRLEHVREQFDDNDD